jgi:polyribonucleotide nucleotidyltransferase
MFGAVHVRPAMLGRVMGREGSNVRAIESSTGARVDAADTGALAVFAPSAAAFRAAREALLAASGDGFLEGETYLCRVQGLKDYGAFLEFPGTGARLLLHISEIAPHKIRAVEDVLEVGQEVEVLCLGRDAKGNVRVSRRAALARSAAAAAGAAAAAAGDALGPDR